MLNWQIGWLFALKDTVHVNSRAPVLVNFIRSIGNQATIGDIESNGVDRWQLVFGRERNYQLPTTKRRRTGGYDQTARRLACEFSDRLLYPAGVTRINRRQLHPQRRCHRLDCSELGSSGSYGGIPDDCCSCHTGCNLFQQFKPFPAGAIFEQGKSGRIAAWTRKACDVASADRVADTDEDDGHRASCALQRCQS